MLQKTIKELYSFGKAFFIAIFISLIISLFIIQPYTVVGSSMEPTFEGENLSNNSKVGDKIMVFKSAYIFGNQPKYQDLVVIDSNVNQKHSLYDELLHNPLFAIFSENEQKDNIWIKRVIGEPGDTLEFKNGKVYRNGTELVEDYIKEKPVDSFKSIVVPEDHIFVMGDNRNDSRDSRDIGPIPIDNVIGKVIVRFYPFDKFDFIKNK